MHWKQENWLDSLSSYKKLNPLVSFVVALTKFDITLYSLNEFLYTFSIVTKFNTLQTAKFHLLRVNRAIYGHHMN